MKEKITWQEVCYAAFPALCLIAFLCLAFIKIFNPSYTWLTYPVILSPIIIPVLCQVIYYFIFGIIFTRRYNKK